MACHVSNVLCVAEKTTFLRAGRPTEKCPWFALEGLDNGVLPDSTCVLANPMAVVSSTLPVMLSWSFSLIMHAMPTAVTGLLSVDKVRGWDSVAHCTIGATMATLGRPPMVPVVPLTRPTAVVRTSHGGSPGTTLTRLSVVPSSSKSLRSYCKRI